MNITLFTYMFNKGEVLSGFLDYNNKLEAHRSKYHLYTKQSNSSMMFTVMDKCHMNWGMLMLLQNSVFWILLMKGFLVETSVWFICARKSDPNPPKIAVRCYEMDEVSDYRKKMKDKVLGSPSSCFDRCAMFLKLLTLDLTPAAPQFLRQVTLADSYSVDFPWLLSWGNWIVLLDFLLL